jgi:hypothetical protein
VTQPMKPKSIQELRALLDGARDYLGFHGPCRSSWISKSNGLRYEVESVALLTPTHPSATSDMEPMVIYRRSAIRDPLSYVIPFSEFKLKFTEDT